ncbi:MAG: methyltransferase [Thermoplasmata archaeon]|nr:MAG: methyltransferase [Thermoplasmata archaeon]
MIREPRCKVFRYKNLVIKTHPEVYEPAEDTFQLLEVLNVSKGDRVLEVGTGCGIIALVCAEAGANVVCSDINPYAVELTRRNYSLNKTCLKGDFEVRQGDLFSVLKPFEQFDVIIFNPPYLPTKVDDIVGGSGWFDIAVSGGRDGFGVVKRFIKDVHRFLAKNGCVYFVFSSLSDKSKLEQILSKTNFKFKVLLTRNYNDEQLDVYRLFF